MNNILAVLWFGMSVLYFLAGEHTNGLLAVIAGNVSAMNK